MNSEDKYREIFNNTSYIVYCDDKSNNIEIGKNNKWIDNLLDDNNGWAFITAFNPLPKILSEDENKKKNKNLESHIRNLGYKYCKGIGIGENNWIEDSFFILNISKEAAMELGKKYGQLAIIYGRKLLSARIIYLKFL